MSPRGIQPVHGFFSEEEKQESIRMEYLAPEGAIISNEAPEAEASKMVVIKWSDKVEGSGDNIESPLCGGLYKKEEDSLVPWSGTDHYGLVPAQDGPFFYTRFHLSALPNCAVLFPTNFQIIFIFKKCTTQFSH